jgi:hydrogenase 3 maturation protease
MCVGNRDGGDDAIGPYVFDRLQQEHTTIPLLDCGTIPENYTGVVKRYKPTTLVLIDAVEMGVPPGEMRIIPKQKIGTMHICTHGIPLSILIQYLEKEVEHITLIWIQPEKMLGTMSTRVKNSGEHLIDLLKKKKIDQIKLL